MGGKENFPRKDETYRILGACFEVYKEKGCGFLEPVYQECLDVELKLRDIPFTAQKPLTLRYKDHTLQHVYQPDFVCFDDIVVEIKALSQLADEHRAQLLNYMNAVRSEVALLVNFGHHPLLEYERFILNEKRRPLAIPFLRDSVCSAGTLPLTE